MVLSRLERRLERLVEGAFAKTSRSDLQPVEIGRRLVREMEIGRTLGLRGPVAPNHYVVTISPHDHARFKPFEEVLVRELGQFVREHARTERYSFVGPVVIDLHVDDKRHAGALKVTARMDGSVKGAGASLALPDGGFVVLDETRAGVIGRLPDCMLRLSDSQVSRQHAELRISTDGWRIRDLGSTNGTIVNGVTVRDHLLTDGDEIVIGGTRLRFQES